VSYTLGLAVCSQEKHFLSQPAVSIITGSPLTAAPLESFIYWRYTARFIIIIIYGIGFLLKFTTSLHCPFPEESQDVLFFRSILLDLLNSPCHFPPGDCPSLDSASADNAQVTNVFIVLYCCDFSGGLIWTECDALKGHSQSQMKSCEKASLEEIRQ